jgi:hypothetical protein
MNKFRFTIKILAIATFLFAFASVSQAQATRTWVSGVGDDANPCSRTAPCKTWAGAISKTADCGEIDALDPGGFGAVTITKSITLDGTGTFASILASLTTGVIVNAASDKVITLRGISINGFCNGIRGINWIQGKTLNIEDCVIFRFANEGILINDSDGMNLNMRNTVIRDNVGDGLSITAGSGVAEASISNCQFNGNSNGLHARTRSQAYVRNSTFSNNTANGVFSDNPTAGVSAFVKVWASVISGNGSNGVQSGSAGNAGGSFVQLGQNQIDHNTLRGVLIASGGTVTTFVNNSITDNGTADGCVGCTPANPGT